ncbi:thiosulfate/3-mercaptopyruvate sulfurtransferase [Sinobacterium caligoides]|uniref:Thiosulfate/3-mercaptopyruvate sulfurtransferase n=1 Tax=Sinobacterium caligoides TaxID=933926 RepID=A0A3N2DG36_9GAMM|nr:rhodanese-like domain-containing protein [Sinobacterium caligoides]ROR98766.1 thiosulfate/3-mercaptopyruvate sulfurtransferase [Sinobacterium caligoides]
MTTLSNSIDLGLLIEPEQLQPLLGDKRLLIVDVSSDQNYASGHIPGSVHISPGQLLFGIKPAAGKIPCNEHLSQLFSRIGLDANDHVVVLDDEGGGWAGRLIWTLDVIGHRHYSVLNGGLVAWRNEGFEVTQQQTAIPPSSYQAQQLNRSVIAELEDISSSLDDANFRIWDARSIEEFEGSKVLAQKGGHIPGAKHLEWTELMDKSRNLRLLPLEQIADMLAERDLQPQHDIVTHCQSHHRSGLTYLVAKLLGYPKIRAYHGSWGEWGNHPSTPVATGRT